MSHQRSIVQHFFPLNVQVPERSFFRKSCSISKNLHKTTLKCSYPLLMYIYMSNQKSTEIFNENKN